MALAGGGNIGLVALGALGTIIPAIFLSEDTNRSVLRQRIVYISLTQPLLAFGVYFFLRDDGNLTQILTFSFLSALLANLAAFALTSYVESIFRLTSGFKLSELADRNHPALRYGGYTIIALLFFIQTSLNIFVNLGVIPTKGLTLPFISYGRSSVIMNFIALAITLRASWEFRNKIK